MRKYAKSIYYFLNYCIAIIWLLNGLFCKVLNLVPRHQEIVARILGSTHSRALTPVTTAHAQSHSERRLVTGFAIADLSAWKLTVTSATKMTRVPARAKIFQFISMRYG